MDAIKTVDLTKRYRDVVAVDRLNLCIEQGEIFALLGVNGAGKSTVVNMLSGLVRPTEGDAFVGGRSICGDLQTVKGLIGVSPQETAVAPNLTVKENLELICGVYGFSKVACRQKLMEITQQFQLQPVMKQRAGKLSGGWKRRVSIAMALISQPKILFLDEPTLGLDVIARSTLWDMIRNLKGQMTILLTTHYLQEAQALADRVGIMKDGKLLFTGAVDALTEEMQTDTFENAFIKLAKEGRL